MNNVLKAMAMNSHLKIASVLVLSIGSLAVGFVAGNRGGDGGVFIPAEDNPPGIEDSNLNGLEDRFVFYYKGIQLESNTDSGYLWVVDSYDLVELTSGDLTLQFQEYVNKEWMMLDEYPIQFTICNDCNWVEGSGEIGQHWVDGLCTHNMGGVSGTFALDMDTQFGGASNYDFGVFPVVVEFNYDDGEWCYERWQWRSLFMHTTLPSPQAVPRYNKYDINDLNQEIKLLWEYLNTIEKCATDVDRDGNTGVIDLLEVVGNWGPCK